GPSPSSPSTAGRAIRSSTGSTSQPKPSAGGVVCPPACPRKPTANTARTGRQSMPKWYFLLQRPGDTTREPIQGEFFSTEAISNTAEALVREGNQNSLDAGREGEKTRVRLFLSGPDDAAALPEAIKPYLEGSWPHYQANQNGLRDIPADT